MSTNNKSTNGRAGNTTSISRFLSSGIRTTTLHWIHQTFLAAQ